MIHKKQITAEVAQIRLENLCARSEHCRHELAEKLRTWGITSDDASKILETLREQRFFDDARFAAAFTRDKVLFGHWGRKKIALALMAKRINKDIIDDALSAIDPEEYRDAAESYLKSKARSIKEGYTYEGRTKLYRSGLSRGYESQLLSPLVKSPVTWGISRQD